MDLWLDRIVTQRQVDVAESRAVVSEDQLTEKAGHQPPAISFLEALQRAESPFAVIAEIKRASPSEGDINCTQSLEALVDAYISGGAAALSVLTEPTWFKGTQADLQTVRRLVESRGANRPAVLRKDFVFCKYQVLEARCWGADTVLLIVALRSVMEAHGETLQGLIEFSRGLGLEPLVEVVTEEEMDLALDAGAKVIGINNRDLTTFKVNIGRTGALLKHVETSRPQALKGGPIFVALSGVHGPGEIQRIHSDAPIVRHFLVGTSLMRAADPVILLRTLRGVTEPYVKICGVTLEEHVRLAVEGGVDLIGLMFFSKSARFIGTEEHAAQLARLVEPSRPDSTFGKLPICVGVFVKESAQRINELAAVVGFQAVQLYGYAAGEIDLRALVRPDGTRLPVIWSVSVTHPDELRATKLPADIAALCVDRKVGENLGGTGQQLDWSALGSVHLPVQVPVLLAGGIDQTNVRQALATPGVRGVDVSSGVETEKAKDPEKIRAFLKEARSQ
eukprot:TRINITY_DN16463_c0_g1_i1.p1 TRINITY_DN16463_c0_g1~~TRINITY_DN16463_c0_g1_i1.p1  ORF type:complete len:506 (-),score=69.50 TRINITY_DN16463_c0_g1_i1:43-1560(-)